MSKTIKKLPKLKDYLKNPFELLRKMYQSNIEYGWWDYINLKQITPDNPEFNDENYFNNHCYIQCPYQVWRHKIGTCWDTSMLIWYTLTKLDKKRIKPYVYFVESFDNDTHTACWYEDEIGYYWFEYSFYQYRGIHGPYKDEDALFDVILDKLNNTNYNNNIKIFNRYVDFTPIYKSNEITSKDFLNCCYLNATFYDSTK